MRITFSNPIKRRLPYLENTVEGILLYGRDNLYPQRMRELSNKSGTTKSSLRVYSKFVRGSGFADKIFNKQVINVFGQTSRDLLREAVDDYVLHKGFAIHVDYNGFLQPVNPKIIKFEYCRYGLPDETGHINKIVVCEDWPKEKGKIKKQQRVDIFNPNPTDVLKQIQRAGGLQNYKGQILYITENANQYPLCSFDEIQDDVETDSKISAFRKANVSTNFLASQVVEYPGKFESDAEREELEKQLGDFQGVENYGKILLIENENAKEKPLVFHKMDIQDNDKLFDWSDNSAQTKIRKNYNQPALLVGDLTPGKLGNSTEIENSFILYNEFTTDDRDKVSEAFAKVFSIMPTVTTKDFTIEELKFVGSGSTAVAPGEQQGPTAAKTGLASLTAKELQNVLRIGARFRAGAITQAAAVALISGMLPALDEATVLELLKDAEDGVITQALKLMVDIKLAKENG
jgi:hypothetical protein